MSVHPSIYKDDEEREYFEGLVANERAMLKAEAARYERVDRSRPAPNPLPVGWSYAP